METEATKFRKLVRWPYQGQLWVHLKKKKKKKKKNTFTQGFVGTAPDWIRAYTCSVHTEPS